MSNARSRSFCFTWPNYPDDHQDILDTLSPRYQLYGYEIAPTTGTLHLQGFLYFENARSRSSVRTRLRGVHVEIAKGSYAANRTYCIKDGDYLEFGEPPATPAEIGQAEQARWVTAWDLAKSGMTVSNI